MERTSSRLIVANIAQSTVWKIEDFLEAAQNWRNVGAICYSEPAKQMCKHIAFMYLARACEMEQGIEL